MGNKDKKRARDKQVRKLANVQRNAAHVARGPGPGVLASIPKVLTLRGQYPNAAGMQAVGPMVKAQWSLPIADIQQLGAAGLPVALPVDGCLIVDTGASHTVISDLAAKDLGLRVISMRATTGVGGVHNSPVHRVHLQLPVDHTGGTSFLDIEQDVTVAIGLEGAANQLGLSRNGVAMRTIGLLGRDFLSRAVMNYDGPGGHFTILLNTAHLNVVNKLPTP